MLMGEKLHIDGRGCFKTTLYCCAVSFFSFFLIMNKKLKTLPLKPDNDGLRLFIYIFSE